jgi:hypothetical protein
VTSVAVVPSKPTGATAWGAAALLSTAIACGVFGLALDAMKLSLAETLAAGVGLMVVLGIALWNYKWAVVLAFLLIGFQIVEPAPVDLVLVIVIAVGFVTGRIQMRDVPVWVVITMGAIIGLGLLSSIEAIKPGRAAFFLGITIYLCAFGVWVCAYVTTPDRARTIVMCLVIVAVVSAIGGSLTLFTTVPVFDLVADHQRVEGLFHDPNIYGPFVVAVSLLLLQEVLEPRVLRWGRPTLTFLLILVVVAGVGATAATVVATGQASFVQERAKFQSYDNQRFGAQKLGIEVAETKPLGIGPGQFEVLSPVSAHSTYIRAGAEQGFVGFLLVLVLFGGTLLVAINNVIWGKDTAGIGSIGLLAIWCGTLANSVFIDTLHWRHLFVFAGLIWSGSLAAPAISQASSRAGVRNPM